MPHREPRPKDPPRICGGTTGAEVDHGCMRRLHYKYQVAAVAVLALFMDLIDLAVVNVALPTLQRDFEATAGEVQWAVTAYILAIGVVMPASGWAADRFGAKRTFLFAV